MTINPSAIIPPSQQNVRGYIGRHLSSVWGTVYRIKPEKHHSYTEWCALNIIGDWSHSIGNEVYYFRDAGDASYFKLVHS